jgi:hypothetical protein
MLRKSFTVLIPEEEVVSVGFFGIWLHLNFASQEYRGGRLGEEVGNLVVWGGVPGRGDDSDNFDEFWTAGFFDNFFFFLMEEPWNTVSKNLFFPAVVKG